jgi:hypothetical protein
MPSSISRLILSDELQNLVSNLRKDTALNTYTRGVMLVPESPVDFFKIEEQADIKNCIEQMKKVRSQ